MKIAVKNGKGAVLLSEEAIDFLRIESNRHILRVIYKDSEGAPLERNKFDQWFMISDDISLNKGEDSGRFGDDCSKFEFINYDTFLNYRGTNSIPGLFLISGVETLGEKFYAENTETTFRVESVKKGEELRIKVFEDGSELFWRASFGIETRIEEDK